MKRSLILGCMAAAALTMGLASGDANAAPVSTAAAVSVTETAPSAATPVHYRRGGGYYRPGFALYLGAPSYGPRCWWSHRYHRRVCSVY